MSLLRFLKKGKADTVWNLDAHLSADSCDLSLVHDGLGDDVGEGPAGEVLHDDPEVVFHHEALDIIHQVWMAELFHYLEIIHNK